MGAGAVSRPRRPARLWDEVSSHAQTHTPMRTIFVIALLALLSACSLLPTDGTVKAIRPDREFTLAEGRRADLLDSRLAVEFVGVPEDQRCPREALCIAAGHAVVRLRASEPGYAPVTLDVRTDTANPAAPYNGWLIKVLELTPAPSASDPDPDYRVRLMVSPVYTGNR